MVLEVLIPQPNVAFGNLIRLDIFSSPLCLGSKPVAVSLLNRKSIHFVLTMDTPLPFLVTESYFGFVCP